MKSRYIRLLHDHDYADSAELNQTEVEPIEKGTKILEPPATVKNKSRMFNFGSLVGGRLKSAKKGEFDSNFD